MQPVPGRYHDRSRPRVNVHDPKDLDLDALSSVVDALPSGGSEWSLTVGVSVFFWVHHPNCRIHVFKRPGVLGLRIPLVHREVVFTVLVFGLHGPAEGSAPLRGTSLGTGTWTPRPTERRLSQSVTYPFSP